MKKQKQTVIQFNLFSNLSINEKINLKSWNESQYLQWRKNWQDRKWIKGWKL